MNIIYIICAVFYVLIGGIQLATILKLDPPSKEIITDEFGHVIYDGYTPLFVIVLGIVLWPIVSAYLLVDYTSDKIVKYLEDYLNSDKIDYSVDEGSSYERKD